VRILLQVGYILIKAKKTILSRLDLSMLSPLKLKIEGYLLKY